MTSEAMGDWRSKLPKNDTIAMRLEPDVAEKIARMAWENQIKTTRQAKLILAAGLNAMESRGEVPKPMISDNSIAGMLGDIPADIDKKLIVAAEKHGRTPQQQAERSLSDGIELQDAIGAVSDYLSAYEKPPFSEDGWKPDESECLTFIKKCIADSIEREKRSLNTKKLIRRIYEEQDGICAKCGKPIEIEEAVRDFKVPLREGGSTATSNTQVVCRECSANL